MIQFSEVKSISLDDPEFFEFLGGLWTGKKPPFTKAGVIRNTNFTSSGEVDYSDVAWLEVEVKQLTKRKLKQLDIIVERSGGGPKQPVGRVVQFRRSEGVFSFSNFTTTIRVKKPDELLPLFAFYVLLELYQSGRTDDIQRRTTGLRNLDFKAYKERAIFPLISTFEQRRVAQILNTVQTAIEQQARLIALMRELKSALMRKLFTEGLRGEKQKETEIGLVPESWEVVKISKAYNFTKRDKCVNLPQPIPFIPMELIPAGQNAITNYETREKATSGTYVEKDDLLIAKITPSFENGKQGILKIPFENAVATTEVIPLKAIKGKSNLLYLHYFLLIPEIRSAMAGKMEGTTGRQRLSKTIVGDQLIPFPTISEQEEISQTLSIFDNKILITQRKKEKLEELFRTLLHQLMTGQTRVNDIDLPGIF